MRKSKWIQVRVSDAELAMYQLLAEGFGVSLSDLVRQLLSKEIDSLPISSNTTAKTG